MEFPRRFQRSFCGGFGGVPAEVSAEFLPWFLQSFRGGSAEVSMRVSADAYCVNARRTITCHFFGEFGKSSQDLGESVYDLIKSWDDWLRSPKNGMWIFLIV